MKNYYQILGIKFTASKEEIKEAYIKLSKKIHPDVNSDDQFFTELFKSINEAHQVLIDDTKRAAYNVKFNNYFLDYNYLREKEQELQTEDFGLIKKQFRKTLVVKGVISVFLMVVCIAIYSFSFNDNASREITVPAKHPVLDVTTVSSRKESVSPTGINKKVSPVNEFKQIFDTRKTLVEKNTLYTKKDLKVIQPPVQKELSEAEIIKAIGLINLERYRYNNKINCVRIIKSANSNVKNAFNFAALLRKNGYVLAGRETSAKSTNGLDIEVSGSCLLLTIGFVE